MLPSEILADTISARWQQAKTSRDWRDICYILHGARLAAATSSQEDDYTVLYEVACLRRLEFV